MTFRERMINDGVVPMQDEDDYKHWRGCTRKRRYTRWSDAHNVAVRTGHGEAYACEFCDGFHVGNSQQPNKGAIE